ncbi:tRNA (adenosine(37)-N6)-threonylcarbamoyltransferase complex dimerization subunit type 1 TsaB [Solicola sp. PLA-1-18]|uniref:tRNA (adenosine(37)-N6)-threonylcarbamoyltransferase complex dimerization subunit type 1 TsaB n=1 Tax=Solicola sp. PLA-1-18 TaxID=3380532 RepID=UPI003B762633
MLVLALDTASPTVSVALHDGTSVVASVTGADAMHHGEQLAPAVARALADAGRAVRDVTAVAVGVGPGPFTGLRVGVVTARTLAASLGVPVHGVCSLDVVAEQARVDGRTGRFCVATDARRKEVYWAAYDADGDRVRRTDGPQVARAADLAVTLGPDVPVLGRGADLYADDLARVGGPADPDAGVLAALVAGGRADVVDPEPLYLRRPDAVPPGARKRAS